MIGSKDFLEDIPQMIEKDKRVNLKILQLELNKYQIILPQSNIIFIDVIPKTKDFQESGNQLLNVCHSTIMITRQVQGERKRQKHVEWVRRSSTILKQLYPYKIQGSNSSQVFCQNLQQSYGLENVITTLKKKKQVEIIKTGWPHGITIQISYLLHYKRWIVSDGKRSRLVEENNPIVEKEAQKTNDPLDAIANFWMKSFESMASKQQIKRKLSTITVVGKIIRNFKQIVFHTVVCNKTGLDFDPFAAREDVQKLGFKYVPLKSLGLFNTQQGLQKCLTKTLNSIRCEFRESANYSNGRAKIFFVQNDGSYLGGVNISTSEDLLFSQMKNILQTLDNPDNKLSMFNAFLGQMRAKLPFPSVSYQKLFQNLVRLTQILGINIEEIEARWFQLPKLCLYMLSKKISFEKYAKICFEKNILDLINDIPLQEFGPIQSKIVLIYSFAHPSTKLKNKIANSLQQSFQAIDAHLSILKLNKIDHIKEAILLPSENLQNYFIIQSFQIKQLKKLQSDLNTTSRDHYYKLIILSESFKGQTILDQNSYPFSWTSIIDTYLQGFNRVRRVNRFQQKLKQLSRVTDQIFKFKNYNVLDLKNRISIKLQDLNERQQLKKLIQNIFRTNQRTLYNRLLTLLQKYDQPSSLPQQNLDVTNILKKSYSSIRTISIKSQ